MQKMKIERERLVKLEAAAKRKLKKQPLKLVIAPSTLQKTAVP